MRRLSENPDLEGVTHVFVDEVHERTIESDFLLMVLRDVLARRADLKLVLMSATLDADLFASGAKFESGTGWPSFATGLPNVEVEATPIEFLSGAELRCARCGGHLGDRFLDGALFPGTPAFASGKRYCIDGSALVFYPADGGKPVLGEFDPGAPRELPAWAQPPGIKVN